MGYNTVIVLLNDHLGEVEDSGPLGRKIGDSVRGYPRRHTLDFGCGAVISQDHANGFQVTVTHGNMGWRIDKVDYDRFLGWQALDQMKACLERNGYCVTKAKKDKQ